MVIKLRKNHFRFALHLEGKTETGFFSPFWKFFVEYLLTKNDLRREFYWIRE